LNTELGATKATGLPVRVRLSSRRRWSRFDGRTAVTLQLPIISTALSHAPRRLPVPADELSRRRAIGSVPGCTQDAERRIVDAILRARSDAPRVGLPAHDESVVVGASGEKGD